MSSRPLDRRAERVELRERAAVVVRHEQPHQFQPAREPLGQARLQLVEALAGPSRHLRRIRKRFSEPAARHLVDAVDLVQHELARKLVRADLLEHLLDGGTIRRVCSSDADASATCSTTSATSVSSSVAAKPSTS